MASICICNVIDSRTQYNSSYHCCWWFYFYLRYIYYYFCLALIYIYLSYNYVAHPVISSHSFLSSLFFPSYHDNEMILSETIRYTVFHIWYLFQEYCYAIKFIPSIYHQLPKHLLASLVLSYSQVMKFSL